MKDRRVVHIVLGLLLATLIAGCDVAERSGSQPGDGPTGQTVLTFTHGKLPGPAAPLQRLLRDFEALHPSLRIDEQFLPSSSDEQHQFYLLNLEGAVRQLDVISIDLIWAQEFARAGWLRTLEPWLPAAERDDFLPNVLRVASFRGAVAALPWFIDVGVLYYRSDLLAKYGLQPPSTFPELARQARLILERENDPRLYGFVWQGKQYEGLVCNFMEYIWGNGGGVISASGRPRLATAPALQAARFVQDMLYRQRVSPSLVSMADEEMSRRIFSNGRAIFHRNWPYAWEIFQAAGSPLRGKVEMSALPGFGKHAGASTLGGWLLGIYARSEHPEASWRLIRFLTSPAAQRRLSLGNGLRPTRQSLYRDADLLRKQPLLRRLRPIIEQARARPVTPFYMMVSQILQSAFSAVVAGQAEPRRVFLQADAQIARVLAAELK